MENQNFDYNTFIDEITKLVVNEIQKLTSSQVVDVSSPSSRVLVLIDPEVEDLQEVIKNLQEMEQNVKFSIIVNEELIENLTTVINQNYFRAEIIKSPKRFEFAKFAKNFDRVVIPFLSLTGLSKISSLTGDEPVSGIALKAVLSGVPVYICTDYLHSLTFSDCERPKKILSIVQEYLTKIQEIGFKPVNLKKLPEELKESKNIQKTAAPVVNKNVVTNEDVMVAVNQKLGQINFPRGTIVTPLARETAKAYGIEINIV